jgi:hypothetical protein
MVRLAFIPGGIQSGLMTFTLRQKTPSSPILLFIAKNDIPFKIFPNPILNQSIKIHSGNEFLDKEVIVRIYDLKGNMLYTDTKMGGTFTVKPEKNLNPGIYLVKLRNQNQIFVEKIVIQ